MRVAVIGTGYVGLVTGTCLAEVGHTVVCVDIDQRKVAQLNTGKVPIYEPGLPELVVKNQTAKRLTFTTHLPDIGNPEAIFFALPTPPGGDGQADLSFVLQAAGDVAKLLKSYTVLINKSTVPVDTTKKVADAVARHTKVDFDVVSNPEFLREGYAVDDFMQPDRIVVGTSSLRAQHVMEDIYRPFIAEGVTFLVMDEASAEITKYAANSFLALKISFMNEVANVCELLGANIDAVKQGVGGDNRIGSRFLSAGMGYGGSCFPKDVLAFEKIAHHHDYDFKLLKAVMEVNDRQKQVLVGKVVAQYGENLTGKTFAVWGLAFKPDTDDIREAPSLNTIRELVGRGATVRAYDPEAMDNVRRTLGDAIHYANSALDALRGTDALLIVTEWKEFSSIRPERIAKALQDRIVFDGRNVFSPAAMKDAGLRYVSIGRKPVNA